MKTEPGARPARKPLPRYMEDAGAGRNSVPAGFSTAGLAGKVADGVAVDDSEPVICDGELSAICGLPLYISIIPVTVTSFPCNSARPVKPDTEDLLMKAERTWFGKLPPI